MKLNKWPAATQGLGLWEKIMEGGHAPTQASQAVSTASRHITNSNKVMEQVLEVAESPITKPLQEGRVAIQAEPEARAR